MKTRISVKIDYELYEKYREYAPDGHKSKILESLIIQYLKEGIPEIEKIKRQYNYICSFTIELSVWKEFKETVSQRHIFETMSSIIEKLLNNYMRSRLV
jgi:hypothetical protein